MRVTVKLFALHRELVGAEALTADLADDATVQEAYRWLGERYPALRGHLDFAAPAINREFTDTTRALHDGDELAIIPPVSGGSAEPTGRVLLTREPLDPVRFITNYSSGKMGYALALMAKRRGAGVTLISGPSFLPRPGGVRFVEVATALEMRDAVMAHFERATVIIKAAAVADYRPAVRATAKIKKEEGMLSLSLERNPDIIAEVGQKKGNRILIGFAMESENLLENAVRKMTKKNMDYIVANLVTQGGAGFQCDTNIVTIMGRDGEREELPMMDKLEVADRILDRIKERKNRYV